MKEENKSLEYFEFNSNLHIAINLNGKEKIHKQIGNWLKNFRPRFLVNDSCELGAVGKRIQSVDSVELLQKMSDECNKGNGSILGNVYLTAVLPKIKSLTFEQIHEALKQDAKRTLKARIEILLENELIDDQFGNFELNCVNLPTRIVFSLKSTSGRFTAYLCAGENKSDISSLVNEVISNDEIFEIKSNLEHLNVLTQPAEITKSPISVKKDDKKLIISVLIIVLSIFCGLLVKLTYK